MPDPDPSAQPPVEPSEQPEDQSWLVMEEIRSGGLLDPPAPPSADQGE